MVSHLEVCLPNKPPKPKNIGEDSKVPQRKLWKEALFMKYEKNKNASLLSYPTPIKSLPEGKKLLRLLIFTIIKECDYSYACTFVAHHCENWSYQIQGIDFDQS